jgi:mRNA interferase MazF
VRPIYVAQLDKRRPVLVLTREHAVDRLIHVTVAPITGTARGIRTEVLVGPQNGLDQASVVSCDNIITIAKTELRDRIGFLLDEQEQALAAAIQWAFDLSH